MDFTVPSKTSKFPVVNFDPSVVRSFLSKLKPSFSVGPDGLCAYFIKNLSNALCIPLSTIFEVSYRTSQIPSYWSKAIVVPIFKKGNPLDVNNYRPISLCCVSCKTMESIMNESLRSHLQTHNLISGKQHGFSKGKSCLTQLLHCKNSWVNSLDKKQCIDVIFIDFSKAFDSVVHKKLISRLRVAGIDGFAFSWLTAFLHGRTQTVKVHNSFSDPLPVTSGVPQGSVLGPILFNIFINDLIESINGECEIYLFADDVKLFSNNSVSLQRALNHVSEWSTKWQLKISLEKCSVLHLGKNNIENPYFINGYELQRTNCVKDLGILTSSTMSSTLHCNELYKKCSRISSLIYKTFLSRNIDLMLQAYKVYVLPILDYCSPVYNPSKISDINKIERIQRKFTKRILGNNLSYNARLQILKLENLEERRLKSDLALAYKILHNQLPILSHIVQLKQPRMSTRTSTKPQIDVPRFKLNIKKYFFTRRVAEVFNYFPVPDTCMERYDPKKFKRSLDAVDLKRYTRGAVMCCLHGQPGAPVPMQL